MTGPIWYRRESAESWDVTAHAWDAPKPDELPRDAERDFDYVDAQGVQHTVYRRIARPAPLTVSLPEALNRAARDVMRKERDRG